MVEPFIGEIRMFGGNYAPLHWTFCAGTLMAVTGNEALYSLLGSAFGGDGRTSFGLPDLRGRIPVHRGTGPGLTQRVVGQQYGVETVTLEATQIPSHSHPLQASSNGANFNSPVNRVPATTTAGDRVYVEPTDETRIQGFSESAVSSVGNDAGHSNLQPFLCVNFIIALLGAYPQRN